ncbi:outer membrane beta-barrel protein [Fulvivirga sp.]|uniref:outer membrane beta-barrel protein n=1 Tax=Fulvivirga sp. TaxID=1931237 RepID=UPI0032EE8C5A
MIRNFTTTFILCSLLALSTVSLGQTEKGNLLLGGGIDLGSTTYKRDIINDQKVFSLNINPGLSYLVTDNFALGINLPISISNQSQDDFADRKSQSIAVGPKLRYYIPFNQWAIFPEVSFALGGGEIETPNFNGGIGGVSTITTKYSTSDFKVGVGITYLISHSIGIESTLSYNIINTEYDVESFIDLETSSIAFNTGFQIYFQTKK